MRGTETTADQPASAGSTSQGASGGRARPARRSPWPLGRRGGLRLRGSHDVHSSAASAENEETKAGSGIARSTARDRRRWSGYRAHPRRLHGQPAPVPCAQSIQLPGLIGTRGMRGELVRPEPLGLDSCVLRLQWRRYPTPQLPSGEPRAGLLPLWPLSLRHADQSGARRLSVGWGVHSLKQRWLDVTSVAERRVEVERRRDLRA